MVNAVTHILGETQKQQRWSTFVNARIFMDVIDNTLFMLRQQRHTRNAYI